jgi:hypothetical protein
MRFNKKVKNLVHFVSHSVFEISPDASPFLATDFIEALSVNDDKPLRRSLTQHKKQQYGWIKNACK